ncbi:MAG: hypothetical protein BWY68_00509 [bacterium ADurb.Bin400]|nr:MAG: hypothetical protein BWY68_00509 [bacterium ADurb.Bin400]
MPKLKTYEVWWQASIPDNGKPGEIRDMGTFTVPEHSLKAAVHAAKKEAQHILLQEDSMSQAVAHIVALVTPKGNIRQIRKKLARQPR